jgi:hypothetical protein
MEDVEDIQTRGTLTEANLRKNLSKIFALPPTILFVFVLLLRTTLFQRCQLFLSPKYQTASSKCQKNARKIQNFWVIFKAQFFTFKYVF